MYIICLLFQSPLSPGKLHEVEQKKLDQISILSSNLLELKKRQSQLEVEKNNLMKEKCERQRKIRLEEYHGKTAQMDEKERELCRKTNQLVDELVEICDNTPFHNALIQILGNLKGIYMTLI